MLAENEWLHHFVSQVLMFTVVPVLLHYYKLYFSFFSLAGQDKDTVFIYTVVILF